MIRRFFLETHISSIEGSVKLIAAKNLSTRISQNRRVQNNSSYSITNISNLFENPKQKWENINVNVKCIAC